MQHKTIPALLYERYQKTPDGIAHYSLDQNGKWRPHSWKEYYSDVSRLAKGLVSQGLNPGQNIGIMAPASRQWDVVQMAILFCGGVVVGLDSHDASENINNIARRTDLHTLIISDLSLLEKLDDEIRNKLKFIISLAEEVSSDSQAENIIPVQELLNNDELSIESHLDLVGESNPATIIFTSGTTGTPKGIQYNHGQVVLACHGILEAFSDINEDSNLVCWLPLSNLYQRIINYCAISVGAATYYVENPRKILQYLPEINPHVFLGVPRFYEKLHGGILENINKRPAIIRLAAEWALRAGETYTKCIREHKIPGVAIRISYQIADVLILKRLRGLMGKNLQYMMSGSAPVSKWLLEQFHGMGFLILEAYGISENVIPIAVNRPNSFKFGTVGKPLPGNEVKLADDGELLVRGPGVFAGYYNDSSPESPLTADGFLATGDYAKFDDEDFLVLTGRKSEIFKTSTGRRISPVKIEEFISRLSYIEHAVISGAGKPFLVALLSLDIDQLKERAKQIQVNTAEDTRDIRDEFIELIKNDVLREVAELQGYLQPAGLLLTVEPFTIEGGDLTANLKVRRKMIMEKYQENISALYEDIGQRQKAQTDGSGRTKEIVVHTL